jgi:hypothetical protein
VRLDPRLLVPLIILGLTSTGAYLVGTRWRILDASVLPRTAVDVLETLGLAVVFLAGNLAVGTAGILGFRVLTGHFVSVYVVSDAVLPILSLIQALVLQRWRERSR